MALKHGTGHAYNQGCRCAKCRAGNTQRARERRIRVRAQLRFVNGYWVSPYATHGTLNGYGNWQCRCFACCDVHSKYLKMLRSRRKARQQ